MTPAFFSRPFRISLGTAILAAGIFVFVARPGIALAHHVDLHATTTCNSYAFDADYVGGDGARHAEVRVDTNGGSFSDALLVGTFDFPAGTTLPNFYTTSGPLPANITVQVKLFEGTAVIDTDTLTVNASASCSTWTPTNTPTATATETPTATNSPTNTATSTPDDTATSSPTATASPENTATNTPETATETATTVATNTPAATETNTPAATTTSTAVTEDTITPVAETPESTPTLVNEVEGLLPPQNPGTTGDTPREVASGLPDAGAGSAGSEGLLQAAIGMVLAAMGLAVAATGMRRREV